MTDRNDISAQKLILSHWLEDVSEAHVQLHEHEGFSGALVWRASLAERDLCLRRWPQNHPGKEELGAMHGLLLHLHQTGFQLAAQPLRTKTGDSFVEHEGRFWELTSWMPGEASFKQAPSPAMLTNAMTALASFHQASHTYSYANRSSHMGCSEGLQRRLAQLQDLRQGQLERLSKTARSAEPGEFQTMCLTLLEGISHSLDQVLIYLQDVAKVPLPLQWCLRDVREEHVLFLGEQVSGLIDYGAVAVDSAAGDLARLLGSLANDDGDTWRAGPLWGICGVTPVFVGICRDFGNCGAPRA